MSNHYDNFQMPNNLNNDNTFSINDHSDSSFTNNHFNSNIFNSNDIINANPNNSSSSSSACLKETGIIEKMLVSYGFIQCCERQARLFFHFSQYLGNIDHLKIGDPVEYEMSYDRRTGKPVAINIRKITSDDLMTKLIKTERVSGVIATEIARNEGRVAFENLGEFFFLPFTQDDVLDSVILKAKDKVSFIIVTDDSGNYRAKDIQLESPNSLKYQGMVSSIKDTFGFIDRSDNMANIFFHSSDCSNFKSMNVGDYVEFGITSRKNKELAINVTKAPNSSEEIAEQVYKGQVVKYNGRLNLASGTIRCTELNQELNFSDKNVKGNFTLYPNDFVTFQICTDRHTQSQRACNINFIIDTFSLNSEPRERGYIASLKETYGFIKSPIREGSLIYFKLTEFLDPNILIKLNDEVEFTLINDAQTKKSQALRISILPNGTVFNILSKKSENDKMHKNEKHKFNNENNNYPLIDLNTEVNDTQTNSTNTFRANGNSDIFSSNVWTMDKPLNEMPSLRSTACDTFTDPFTNGYDNDMNGEYYGNAIGIIVAIKESYCFIESIDGENEYFGHQSGYIDLDLEMGQTVEFVAAFLNGKWKATSIRKKQNVAKYEGELSDIYTGIVLRTIQMFNPDQAEYPGLIARSDHLQTLEIDLNDAFKIEEKYEFSMTSFKFLKDYISVGDMVKFQVAISPITKKRRAFNIEVLRERIKGTIYVISRMYGFVKADIDNESKKIYFNRGEVSGSPRLKIGDPVDFYLVENKKSDKQYAIDIVKLEDLPNCTGDERPLFKNLAKDKETGPKVIVIRQPRAPDGTKGFTTRTEENGQ